MSVRVRFPFDDRDHWEKITSSLKLGFNPGIAIQLCRGVLASKIDEHQTKTINDSLQRAAQGLQAQVSVLMAQCALWIERAPQLFSESVPFLFGHVLHVADRGHQHQHSFTRAQCCSILCMGLFGCFRDYLSNVSPSFRDFFPHWHFDYLLAGLTEPLKCLLHYVERVALMTDGELAQLVSFRRVAGEAPDWHSSTSPVCSVSCTERPIEMCAEAEFHADFANKYLGGGVLHGGNVQEEILFVVRPECLVGLLICPVMADNEAILIENPIMISRYTGYGNRWKYAGDFDEEQPTCPTIVAIDACRNDRGGGQFGDELFQRDLRKVYVALETAGGHTFATGNWGCGVFGGDIHLKFFQQLLACSERGCKLLYAPFGDKAAATAINAFIPVLEKYQPTVGQLYSIFRKVSRNPIPKRALLDIMAAELQSNQL